MPSHKYFHAFKASLPAFLYLAFTTSLLFFVVFPHLSHSYLSGSFKISNPALSYGVNISISEIILFSIIALTTLIFALWDHKDAAFCGIPLNAFGLRHFCYGGILAFTGALLLGVFEYCFGGFRISGLVWPLLTTGAIIALAAFWVFFVSLTEELWFRGYPLKKFEDSLGWWPAALITSCAFAACHMHNQNENYAEMVFLFLSGLILCGLRCLSGSLWLGIGAHAVADLAGIVLGTPGTNLSGSPIQIVYLTVSGSELINGGDNGLMFSLPGIGMQFLLMIVPLFMFSRPFVKKFSA
ncbi:CPBP family intramembrane glutamic endopeptidase [Acetobacter persici]|uniref:CPBP family intramembrane glutamic endopeptidase n=1 Tax=Acetobacter persici TaxID=1076596 RepID=UPI0015C50896|nr:type II CAAX endopeptidase family protein [Acetobacter persici]